MAVQLHEDIPAALNTAADKLGLDDFRPQQRTAIEAFLHGRDVFVTLPTGFGKSAIYQAAPICCDFIRHSDSPVSIGIVISPLSALMTDQLEKMKGLGISAATLTKETSRPMKNALANGNFSLVFASPEAMLSSFGRNLLGRAVYRKNLCGIFVDESHCIQKWGYGDGKVEAFRGEYGHIGELRSLVASTVPAVALTATATASTRGQICKSLGLRNPFVIAESPKRDNIKLTVVKVRETDVFETFKWKLKDLQEKKMESERMIIYCRTKQQCNNLYAKFEKATKPTSSEERLFAKFHSQTDGDIKSYIQAAMSNEKSHIRLLFATVAFGMGVDVKALRTVVHYGAPHDIEEFVQESGRAGRDGKQSTSILVMYPGAGKITRPNEAMKGFIKCSTCRRKELLSSFGDDDTSNMANHFCCDICAVKCDCGQCPNKSLAETSLNTFQLAGTAVTQTRIVVEGVRASLQEQLNQFRLELLSLEGREQHYIAGGDITTGFPGFTASRIVEECHLALSFDEFISRYTFYNRTVAEQIFQILQEHFKDCSLSTLAEATQTSTSSSDADISSTSEQYLRPDLISSSDSD